MINPTISDFYRRADQVARTASALCNEEPEIANALTERMNRVREALRRSGAQQAWAILTGSDA